MGLIKCPITILHAEVDKVAPIAGSEKIVEDANKVGKTNIKLIKFKEEGLGHIGISKHEDFPKVIRNAIIDAHEHYKNTMSKIWVCSQLCDEYILFINENFCRQQFANWK